MSPFNWFRRFDNPSEQADQPPAEDASTQAAEETDQADETEVSAEPEPAQAATTSETNQSAQDYLQWAKAAYQNIQKQQTAPAAETTAAPAETETTETAVAASPESQKPESQKVEEETEAATPVAKAPEVEAPEVEATEPESAQEVAPELAPDADAEAAIATPTDTTAEAEAESAAASAADVTTETSETSETTEAESATSAAPMPFWAQAQSERQERLERLRATAAEAPEPEPVAPVAETAATSERDFTAETPPELLEFDEGFLWSAEVLASQGRRPEDVSVEEITWLKRLRQGLGKTRRGLVNQLKAVVGQGPLNQDAVMEIEALMLQADVGIEATDQIISSLQDKLRQEALPPDAAIAYLKRILQEMLDRPLEGKYNATFAPEKETLNIWLITGVNGAGKTTTIGKIAHLAQKSDYRCLIAAADTFRAAAVEQVKVWGTRSNTDVIANPGKNTDPAAVVFDAISAANSRQTELLLVDTAGRLQNKKNLMEELSKIRRIVDKKAPDANIESLLVLDATLGQNGLRQAEVFAEAAQLSGVVLTKLDGTAKGGIALAVVQQLGLPIRFIGAGEGIEDLRPFSSYEFVEALLSS
jgi:fused signal recognition particle receptor